MTNSNDDSAPICPESLLFEAEQFESIFQVLKEASNLPDQRLAGLGWGEAGVAAPVAAARKIEHRLSGARFVRIVFTERKLLDDRDLANEISEVCDDDGHLQEIQVPIERSLLTKWGELAKLVISSLSSRELSLRTGYAQEELLDTIGKLSLA